MNERTTLDRRLDDAFAAIKPVGIQSGASLIEEGDRLVEVKIVLYATVNVSAYEREYGEPVRSVDLKNDITSVIHGAAETGFVYGGSYPEGIVLNVNLR